MDRRRDGERVSMRDGGAGGRGKEGFDAEVGSDVEFYCKFPPYLLFLFFLFLPPVSSPSSSLQKEEMESVSIEYENTPTRGRGKEKETTRSHNIHESSIIVKCLTPSTDPHAKRSSRFQSSFRTLLLLLILPLPIHCKHEQRNQRDSIPRTSSGEFTTTSVRINGPKFPSWQGQAWARPLRFYF